MADREFIEFVLTATDLASRKLNQAANAIEQDTRRIEQSAKGASREMDQLGQSMDKTGGPAQTMHRSLSDVRADLEKMEAQLGRTNAQIAKAPAHLTLLNQALEADRSRLESHVTALRNEAAELERAEQRLQTLPGAFDRLSQAIRRNITTYAQHSRALQDLGRVAGGVERAMGGLARGVGDAERAFGGFLNGIGKSTKELEQNAKAADRAVTSWERLGSRWDRGTSAILRGTLSLAKMSFGLVTSAGLIGALVLAIGPLAGAAEAGGAGIFSLASALSTLSATAVGIPAVLTAVAGSIAAITTILRPAVSGILQYVAAAGKAQQATTAGAGGGGGSTGTAGTVLGLEKQLHNLRMQNALQEKQAEQNLATLKLNVAQQLIQDQQNLNALRATDRIKEQDAQQTLASDKARLKQLEQEGAPKVQIAAAKAQVQQDQEDLHKVIIQNKNQEGAAERKLQSDKRNGDNQIKQAEEQLHQLKLQNAQQELALQRQLTGAQTGSNTATAKAIDLYKNLSPLQKQVADQILALKNRWKDLTAVFRDRFLHELLTDLQDVNRFLPQIAKTVGAFANTITDTIANIRTRLVTPSGAPTALGQRVGGFVDFIHTQQRIALGLGTSGQAAGGGLLDLATAMTRFVTSKPAQEFIHFMAEAVDHLGKWALNAEKAGEKTGGIAKFFDHATAVAKIVGDIIKNLGEAVFNIGKISFPTGKGFLQALDDMSRRFERFTASAKGRNEIKRFFDDARETVRAFDRAIIAVVGNVAKLGRSFLDRPGGGQATRQGPGGRVIGNAGAAGPAGQSPLQTFFDDVTKVAPQATNILKDTYKILGALAPVFQEAGLGAANLAKYLKDFIDFVNQNVPYGNKILGGLLLTFILLPKVMKPVAAALKVKKWLFDPQEVKKSEEGVSRLHTAFDKLKTGVGKIKDLGGGVLNGIKDLSKNGIARLKDLTTKGFEAAASHAKDLRTKIGEAATAAKDLGRKGFDAAISSAKDLGGKMATAATNMGNFLKSVGQAALVALKNFAIMVGTTIVGALESMAVALGIATVSEEGFTLALSATGIGAIIVVIGLLIAAIILIATHWDQTKKIVLDGVHKIRDLMGEAWGKIKQLTSDAWGFIKDFITHHWDLIIGFFTGTLGIALLLDLFGGPSGVWEKLKSLASKAWDAIKGIAKTAWGDLVKFFTDTAPGAIKSAFTSIWDGVAHVSAIAINKVIGVVNGFLNGIGGGIDFVLRHIGLSSHQLHVHNPIGTLNVPDAAEGGIFRPVPGGMYRFVEAGHPEAVVPLDPTKRDRAVEIMRAIADHMGNTPSFASGGVIDAPNRPSPGGTDPITGAIGGVFNTIGEWIGSVKDHLPSVPHIAGELGTMAEGALGWVKDRVVSWAESEFSSLASRFLPHFGETPTISPQTLRGLLLSHKIDRSWRYLGRNWGTAPQSAALHRYPGGVPPWNQLLLAGAGGPLEQVAALALGLYDRTSQSDLIALVGRALQESGGMTAIINQWDSNWLKRIPSIGLLQTIAPTFNSYARKPFTNIWDPLHNAVAAIGYMLAKYHHIVGPSGSGYALGGLVGDHKAGLTAGGLREGQPIRILAHVGEWVLNREQQEKLAHLFGGRDRAFHALFNTPSFGGAFQNGGVVGLGLTPAAAAAGAGAQVQVGPIHTTSPQIDVDYIVRAVEMRLGVYA